MHSSSATLYTQQHYLGREGSVISIGKVGSSHTSIAVWSPSKRWYLPRATAPPEMSRFVNCTPGDRWTRGRCESSRLRIPPPTYFDSRVRAVGSTSTEIKIAFGKMVQSTGEDRRSKLRTLCNSKRNRRRHDKLANLMSSLTLTEWR